MAIENELSNDIAIALLTGKERDPERLNNLKEVVLKIHASLHEQSDESYANRTSSKRGKEIKREQF
jgi:hypothetical protein